MPGCSRAELARPFFSRPVHVRVPPEFSPFLFLRGLRAGLSGPSTRIEVFGSGKQTGQYGSPWSRRQSWPHSGQQTHSRIGNVQTGQMAVIMIRSFPQHVEEQDHFLKMSGQPPCFSLRSLVQRRKERFAEIPCALERPEPSRLYAAPGSHELAGALQRPRIIARRDLDSQRTQVKNVWLPIRPVFLPAADIIAGRADLPRIFFNERRGLDQEPLESFCGQNADIHHGTRKKMFPIDRRDMMRKR